MGLSRLLQVERCGNAVSISFGNNATSVFVPAHQARTFAIKLLETAEAIDNAPSVPRNPPTQNMQKRRIDDANDIGDGPMYVPFPWLPRK